MQPALIVVPGCTYGVWVAQRTLAVTAVKDCAPRFSTNANNKPTAEFVLKRGFPDSTSSLRSLPCSKKAPLQALKR